MIRCKKIRICMQMDIKKCFSEVALLLSLLGQSVGAQGVLILFAAGNVKCGGQAIGRVTHGLTGGELRNGGQFQINDYFSKLKQRNLIKYQKSHVSRKRF